MRKILSIVFLLAFGKVFSQPPTYVPINSQMNWKSGYFRGLHIPPFNTTPSLNSGQWNGAGAIGLDTVLHKPFYYSGGTWRQFGDVLGTRAINTTFPIQGGGTLAADKTIYDALSAEGNGITTSGDQTSALNTLLATSTVKTIEFNTNGNFTISGSLNAKGKTLVFKNGAKLVGTGSIDSLYIVCDYETQCIDSTLNLTNIFNDEVYVMWFGAKHDWDQNSLVGTDLRPVLQQIRDALPVGYGKIIWLPEGTCYLSDSVDFIDRPVTLMGYGGSIASLSNSSIFVGVNKNGIGLRRTSAGWQGGRIMNINFFTSNVTVSGNYLVKITAHSKIEYCRFAGNSKGIGLEILGSVGSVPSTDASLSYIQSNHFSGDSIGLWCHGEDANQICFINNDYRDCHYGYLNDDFLGNQHFSEHFNNNDSAGFYVSNANAHENWFGLYVEGGSGVNYVAGTSNIWGGIDESGTSVDATFRGSSLTTLGAFNINTGGLSGSSTSGVNISTPYAGSVSQSVKITGSIADNSHYPGIAFVGGTFHPSSPAYIKLENGGVELDIFTASGSSDIPGTVTTAGFTLNGGVGSSSISVYTGGGEKSRFQSAGGLTINTTSLSGSEKLRVNGKILNSDIDEYEANYGSSFTTRTKVDKGYVDSVKTSLNLSSGSYTPTLTNTTNISASTAYLTRWSRNDSMIIVSGKVDIDPTAGGAVELRMSLPISIVAFSNDYDAAGTANSAAVAAESAAIMAVSSTATIAIKFIAVDLSNKSYFFTFTFKYTGPP